MEEMLPGFVLEAEDVPVGNGKCVGNWKNSNSMKVLLYNSHQTLATAMLL